MQTPTATPTGMARFGRGDDDDNDGDDDAREGGQLPSRATALRWTAPECLRGQSEGGFEADVFSLAITLWEVLAREQVSRPGRVGALRLLRIAPELRTTLLVAATGHDAGRATLALRVAQPNSCEPSP